MQTINEEKINEIRNSSDIVEIISDYIPLQMRGKNYFGICPFHDDHTPSMSVSKEKQLYKCFVCNKGGNVFNFIQNYENLTFIEAVKKVADKVGIPLNIDYVKKENPKYKKEFEIMEFATNIFQNNLNSKEGTEAKKYLKERNINDKIIKDFKIGLSLSDNKYLYNVLTKKGYDINILDDLGLISKSGIDGYDKFTQRIMIPICNLDGLVVGYTGRIYNSESSSKYINTKETMIYKKGHILFNYHLAKNYIREEKAVILVEGNMDAIRLYSEDIKNVLALMGTVITKEQIEILKKLRVPVILILDNDDAGKAATLNVGEELTKNNIECKVVRLEGAKDPDEYIINFGKEKFKKSILNSISFFDYKIECLKENKNLNNIEELITYVKSVVKMLNGKDNLTKEITIKKISEEYNIDYEILKSEITFEETKKVVENTEPPKKKLNIYEKCVHKIFYYLMSDKKYVTIFNNIWGYFENKNERELLREIEYYIDKYDKITLADFLSYAENNDKIRDIVHNINDFIVYEELNEQIFIDYVEKLEELHNKEDMQKFKAMLNSTTDEVKQLEILNKIKELKRKGVKKNGRD